MKFLCPTCDAWRHVDEEDDPRGDRCWQCGTRVPRSDEELKRMDEDERDGHA